MNSKISVCPGSRPMLWTASIVNGGGSAPIPTSLTHSCAGNTLAVAAVLITVARTVMSSPSCASAGETSRLVTVNSWGSRSLLPVTMMSENPGTTTE